MGSELRLLPHTCKKTCSPNCQSLKALAGLSAPCSMLLGHLSQAFFERIGLLKGVRRRCRQLRTILGIPLLIFLLSHRPVSCTRAVRGHVECLDLVDVVVIQAPLGEDVLAPCAPLPIAAVICAGREHLVALLQVCREHLDCRLGDNFQVAEEAILDVRTVLVVEAVRRVSWFGAQPSPQTLGDENGIGVDLDGVVCRLPLAHLTDLHPDLVENPPIHPSARNLSLQLVELAELVFHFERLITIVHFHCHVAEHIPLLASEDALGLSRNNVQQLELMVDQFIIAYILCVHRETIEVLPKLGGDRHRVRIDDAASESLLARCAGLLAVSLSLSLCEALVPRDLAATSAGTIISSFRAIPKAGHDLDSLLFTAVPTCSSS